MPNDCENRLTVSLVNEEWHSEDLTYWRDANQGRRQVPLSVAARHAYLMGAGNTSVPTRAEGCPASMARMTRDLNELVFEFASEEVVPDNYSNRSRSNEVLSFKYATPGYQRDSQEWFTRHCDLWGTKWDAYGVTLDEDEDCLNYEFFTAWAPPLEWADKAARYWEARVLIGRRVVLHGMQREELNGQRGRVVDCVDDLWNVCLDSAARCDAAVQRDNMRLCMGGGTSRALPSYQLELTYGECGCNFSGHVLWEGGVRTNEAEGKYGEYYGEAQEDPDEDEDDEEDEEEDDAAADDDDDDNDNDEPVSSEKISRSLQAIGISER